MEELCEFVFLNIDIHRLDTHENVYTSMYISNTHRYPYMDAHVFSSSIHYEY